MNERASGVRLCGYSMKILSQFHFISPSVCFLSWKEEECDSIITHSGIFEMPTS